MVSANKKLDESEKTYTSNWVVRYYRLWERMLLPHFNKRADLTYVEVGVWEGRSACWMLDNLLVAEGSRAYCIDTFQGPSRASRVKKFGTGAEIEARARANLTSYGAKAEVLKGKSSDCLASDTIQELAGRVDLFYVDGQHDSGVPFQDTVAGWELLRIGGIMMWDDVNMAGVIPDLHAFLGQYAGRYKMLWWYGRLAAVKKES